MTRRVCHFSCGAASAVAAKITLKRHPDAVVVNAFLAEEHPDNQRFLNDVEKWLGVPVVRLRDERFGASAYEVFRRFRFTRSKTGAKCSSHLKRQVLDRWKLDGDIAVLGYTCEETERADRFLDRDATAEFPLIDGQISKADCLAMIQHAGLILPEMYRLGYNNANCIGCVKGGAGYWNKIRRDFPERFEEMCRVEELIGPGSYLFRDRKTGVRFPLRQLDPSSGRHDEPLVECGFSCMLMEEELNNDGGEAVAKLKPPG